MGATHLAYSKYASPQQKKVAFAALAAAAASNSDNVIATKEQIAASNGTSEVALDTMHQNSDAQLAIAQGNKLKEEVDEHAAKLSRTVSSTVANTRRLLELIRQSTPDAAGASMDTLWKELEQLFVAVNDANAALPVFLEKQRNNMSLYHTSMMNEAIQDTQEELKISHKKVNIQHSLILDHQEAFQEYKAQTTKKLEELQELQERVSRLTLEKGNFRTEVDKYVQLLEEERSTKSEDLRKVVALQKELDTLVASKKELLAEIDALRKQLGDFHGKMEVTEQDITERFTRELKSKAELLEKETQKTNSLNAMMRQLKSGESLARLEADKAKKENVALSERYSNQAAEHGKAFTKLNDKTKELESLRINAGRLQNENIDLKQQLTKLAGLENRTTELNGVIAKLSEQVSTLAVDLKAAKDEESNAKKESDGLLKKVETLNKEMEHLESENKHLLGVQADGEEAAQSVRMLERENVKLQATIDELQTAKSTASGTLTAVNEESTHVYEDKIAGLETALLEWTDLAKRSYTEYKSILPVYRQAEQHRKDNMEMEEEIKSLKLKLKLSAADTDRSSGTAAATASGNVGYWKEKYEALLCNLG